MRRAPGSLRRARRAPRGRARSAAARRPDRSGRRLVGPIDGFAASAEAVDADDDRVAGVDGQLRAVRRLLNLALDEPGLDRRQRAADARRSARAAPRRRARSSSVSASIAYEPPTGSTVLATPVSAAMICCVRSAMPRRLLGRQRQRLVAAVAVQRLRAAEHRGHRLERDADDVVVGLLRGQRAAGGLGVEAQLLRARVGGAEAVAHDARPQPPRGAELGDLLEEVVVGVEEERQPLAELR